MMPVSMMLLLDEVQSPEPILAAIIRKLSGNIIDIVQFRWRP